MFKLYGTVEELIEDVLSDLNFNISSKTHRKYLLELLGSEEKVMALEDFIKHRFYDEGEFMLSISDMLEIQ